MADVRNLSLLKSFLWWLIDERILNIYTCLPSTKISKKPKVYLWKILLKNWNQVQHPKHVHISVYYKHMNWNMKMFWMQLISVSVKVNFAAFVRNMYIYKSHCQANYSRFKKSQNIYKKFIKWDLCLLERFNRHY